MRSNAKNKQHIRKSKLNEKRQNDKRAEGFFFVVILSFGILLIAMLGFHFDSYLHKNDHVDEIRMPVSAKEYKKDDVKIVVQSLTDLGFMNIETEALEDLKTGWIKKENAVDSVYINDNSEFADGDWFPKQAEVHIYYHSFKEE